MDNQNKKNSHHNFSKRQLMLKINEQIKEATLLHQKGQWSKAECIYTKVLQQDENNK